MLNHWVHRALLFVAFILHFCIAYWIDRADAGLVIGAYGILAFLFLVQWADLKIGIKQIIALGFLLRLVYLVAVPELSDDVFRYIWDGFMSTQGISPYEILPSDWITATSGQAFQELYPLLNSPDYYSIYPPVLQLFFVAAAWLSNGNVLSAIIIFRVFVLFAELGSMLLMVKLFSAFNMNKRNLLLYALNPLVIVEFTGNLHGEVFMVFFLLLSLWLLTSRLVWVSALAFAGAVGVKLLPLMFLPFYIKRLGWLKAVGYGSLVGLISLLMFLPFWSEGLVLNTLDTLRLYFTTFEFNASIYYIIREIGFQVKGYNIIGMTAIWLPRVVLILILLLALFNKGKQPSGLPKMMMFAWFIYYALATTVNTWYVAVLAAFLPFVKYRFALIWLLLVPLSYHAFGNADYVESLWLIVLEYVPVYLLLLFELGWLKPLERWWAKGRAEVKQKRLKTFLKEGTSVLEVGTGNGALSSLLQEDGYQIEPLDICDQSIYPSVHVKVYGGSTFPFQEKQFDTCQLITMLHHTTNAEELINEAKRVSNRVIIMEDVYESQFQKYVTWFTDSLINWEFYGHPHTNRTDEEWKALFQKNGLKLIEAEYYRFLLLFKQVTYVLEPEN